MRGRGQETPVRVRHFHTVHGEYRSVESAEAELNAQGVLEYLAEVD